MAAIHRLLQNLLAIEETTPYQCNIEASSETDHQCLQGDVTFQVENGSLTFNFFPREYGLHLQAHQLCSVAGQENAKTVLSILLMVRSVFHLTLSQDFEYAVRILSLPHPGTMTVGLPINRPEHRVSGAGGWRWGLRQKEGI